jgi:hypothetical protein
LPRGVLAEVDIYRTVSVLLDTSLLMAASLGLNIRIGDVSFSR